jgi:DnaJ-class molecular chaperone
MTKYSFYPTDIISDKYDNLKKNFHNLLLYYNPNQYIIKKELASKNYQEILNLYNLFNSNPKSFESCLILNRINRVLYKDLSTFNFEQNNSVYPVTLEQLYKNFITINETCKICLGIGLNNIKKCTKCQGSKKLDFLVYNQYNVVIRRGICDECDGKGLIGFGENCNFCHGLKYTPIQISLEDISPLRNSEEDSSNTFKIKHNEIFYTFYLQMDPEFSKREKDLVYTLNIHLSDLINGFQYKINLLNRTQIILKSKDMMITNPGKEYVFPNLGFITQKGVGNLIIRLNIIYPKTLQEFHLKKSDNYIITEKDKFIDIFEI